MGKEKICGIYKIQNKINNMIYIGQSINILERFSKHKRAYGHFDINNAIRDFGANNFTYEIIEKCSPELLNEREKYWIKYYDSYNKGYNMTTGGAGTPMSNNKIVCQYDLQGNFIKEYLSEKEAAEALNTDARYISNCCLQKNNSILNYQFCFKGNENTIKINPKTNPGYNKKPVSKYDLQGRYICNYDSVLSASLDNGNDTKGIIKCCNKESFSAQGFLQTQEGDPAPNPYNSKEIHSTTNKKVDQFTLDGHFIKTYNSCKEAAEAVGLTGASCIIRVCKDQQKTTKGYIQKYHKE